VLGCLAPRKPRFCLTSPGRALANGSGLALFAESTPQTFHPPTSSTRAVLVLGGRVQQKKKKRAPRSSSAKPCPPHSTEPSQPSPDRSSVISLPHGDAWGARSLSADPRAPKRNEIPHRPQPLRRGEVKYQTARTCSTLADVG
jgi:hypothetical protein